MYIVTMANLNPIHAQSRMFKFTNDTHLVVGYRAITWALVSVRRLLDIDRMTITAAEAIHIYAISAAFDVCLKSYSPPTAAVGLGLSP